jgi:phenylalanyl-tRNA synthetase beta chain
MFLAREVRNVKIEASPKEIKEKLIASGIRPINNVVDISNYVMLETGQPLHFYDADKLNGLIEVRMAEEGEKLTTLDSKERTLSKDDIVISDGKKAIGLAGVMGGLETEITENTKNIIVESAIFDSVKVRRTSNKILRSEASNRFEKGLDPNRTYMAMERACTLLEKYAYAKILKGMAKYDKTEKEPKKIDITNTKINKVLGPNIDIKDTINVLERLGFEVQQHVDNKDLLTVIVPTRRLDISIPEDLIEEVGRIYGVDNIEGKVMVLPLKEGTFDRKIRDIRNEMVDLGLSETLTYSLVNEKESSMFTLGDKESIKILSPLTEERSHLRQSLITSLYKIYEYNLARNISDVSIFEIGKAFYKDGESYNERNKLAALMTGKYIEGLHGKDVDFYVVKGIVEEVLDFLGYGGRYSFLQDNNKIPKDFHPGISAVISVNNDIVGVIGKLNPKICSKDVYAFEIDLDKLGEKRVSKMKYKEISKFPSVKKDIAVIVDKNVSASEMQKIIKSNGGKLLINNYVFDLYEGIGIPKGKKSIAFTLEIGAQDKTLTDEEIANVVTKITDALKKKYGAELRS